MSQGAPQHLAELRALADRYAFLRPEDESRCFFSEEAVVTGMKEFRLDIFRGLRKIKEILKGRKIMLGLKRLFGKQRTAAGEAPAIVAIRSRFSFFRRS